MCGNVDLPGGVWQYGDRGGDVVAGTVSWITLHVEVKEVVSLPSEWLIPSDDYVVLQQTK